MGLTFPHNPWNMFSLAAMKCTMFILKLWRWLCCTHNVRHILLKRHNIFFLSLMQATRKNLEEDLNYALTSGFEFGLKLVRGAYMVTERRLACELGYEDPVNETFDLTSASYHSCLDFLLEQLVKRQSLSLRFVIASHNEDTVRYAMTR